MNKNDKETIIITGWLIFAIILTWFGFFTRLYDGGEYITALGLTGLFSLIIALVLIMWIDEKESNNEQIEKLEKKLSKTRKELREYQEKEEQDEAASLYPTDKQLRYLKKNQILAPKILTYEQAHDLIDKHKNMLQLQEAKFEYEKEKDNNENR